jgi:HAMP domain-containing protein
VIAVIFVSGLVSYALLDNLLGSIATAQINDRSRSLMQTMLAVRQYAGEQTTPIIEPMNFNNSTTFLPESVPSYAAKSVFVLMQGMPQFRAYRYREAVVNPTNSDDLPTELEAAIVQRFKSNAKLKEISGDDLNPILPFHYIAHPLTVTDSSCLRCHATPDQAPLSLLNQYGSKNGFGWKVGEIIGAQVVKVPMERVYKEKRDIRDRLLVFIIVCLVSLAVIMFVAMNYLLVRPLARFSVVADTASQSPNSAAFPKSSAVEELNRLQRSLERLRVSLLVAMNMANKP